MRINLLLLSFLLLAVAVKSQTIQLKGNITDTLTKQSLPNVLLMAIKFSDSTLVGSTRSNKDGVFKSLSLPLDTYLVILSHPNFNDKTYLLAPSPKDTVLNFKNAVLPPKSVLLNEVEIFAYKEKIYYKGDTLVFTADSFKTRPNASVEDLLKKLPGVSVDAKGKITIQGKEVDQVLVDGDEFFGGDPTVATRNLNATAVENVQVYDKKNESTEDGKSETLKVVNLKLKEDAKKGYFGKVSGASDFTKFYENEILLNKFKGNLKVSAFGLIANTPKQAFDWGDINKYGLSGEQNMYYDEDSENRYYYGQDQKTGVPQTIKSGFYFSDKFGKNTKLNADYTFNQNSLNVSKTTNTQFFLQDTSYTNTALNTTHSKSQNHALNFKLVQKLDSLTELTVTPKVKYNLNENTSFQKDDFISQDLQNTRRTEITNKNKSESSDLDVLFKVKHNFMKKDRLLTVNYQPVYNSGITTTTLNSNFVYFLNQENNKTILQTRRQNNYKMSHNVSLNWVEPLTKKMKLEFSYNLNYAKSNTTRITLDKTGGSDLFNPQLSNNFDNLNLINKGGVKYIYDVKKYRLTIGSYLRNIQQKNTNLTTNKTFNYNVPIFLPMAGFNYRINQGSSLSFQYSSSAQQPDASQLQPVTDNTDPNRISIGNPALKPSFRHNGSVNYYFYKSISNRNLYSGMNYGSTANMISYSTTYDSLGRAVSQPINIKSGNNYTNFWLGGGLPIFKNFMKLGYNLNANLNNNSSIINGKQNASSNAGIGPGISLEKETEKFEIRIAGDYDYTIPKNEISSLSTQPYYTYNLSGNVLIRFPKKIILTTDAVYTNNGNRSDGYNINYVILNAALAKNFLKSENLVVSVEANDILNQNISNQRNQNSNQITDTKTTIIKRYFLLKVLFKFNSQKTKEEGDDD
jgi:hypothetical protein